MINNRILGNDYDSATASADHKFFKERAAENKSAPLRYLRMLIEYKSPALSTLMHYIPRDCPETKETISEIISYLTKWEKYPGAILILQDWLDQAHPNNAGSVAKTTLRNELPMK